MSNTCTLNLEVERGEGYAEDTFEVEFDYEPYTPGRLSGPPEDCYQAEGGYADACNGDVYWIKEGEKLKDGCFISFGVFLATYAKAYDIENDPSDAKYPKTALEKAANKLDEELTSYAADAAEAAAEDAACDRYHYDKENDLI